VHILSYDSHFVSALNAGGGVVTADRPWAREWETFTIRRADGDSAPIGDDTAVQFETYDGKHWLTAPQGGGKGLDATGNAPGAWQTFTVFLVGRPNFPITVSVDNQAVSPNLLI